MFDSDKSQVGDIEKDRKEGDKKDIDVSTVDSYSHAVIMMRMR